ncbi:unnamed protein product [Brachionus calyciflorus]|uniref:Transmembrane protein 107 n=1 Tax=Brachionus calyciflorus TaxID=104777 RepID=A0A814CES9_9BILA|nr:unnamed protein product [Brachionus calyciflorus]
MGLKSVQNGLVPTRFMCMLAHMVMLISLLIRRNEYVGSCDTVLYQNVNLLNNQFIIGLSISIGILAIELVTFITGITLFNTFQSLISTFLHSSAAISLSIMVFFKWCSVDFWYIFGFCSCIPFIFEIIFLIGIWLFKRTIN